MNKLNLPNKLTILRIVIVPFFVAFMALTQVIDWAKYVALGLYVIASVTDFLDGFIARKYNAITSFGKIVDPLADKLLVSAGFIMVAGTGIIPAWIAVIIIFRDMWVSTLRIFASKADGNMAAGFSGKIKTVFQLVGICLAILDTCPMFKFVTMGKAMGFFPMLLNVCMSIAVAVALIFTIWSCIDYTLRYKKYIVIDEAIEE